MNGQSDYTVRANLALARQAPRRAAPPSAAVM
jgi:hypothetical protein